MTAIGLSLIAAIVTIFELLSDERRRRPPSWREWTVLAWQAEGVDGEPPRLSLSGGGMPFPNHPT